MAAQIECEKNYSFPDSVASRGFCFGFCCDFFYGFWCGCGCHGVAYPCAYGHYGYEDYGDWCGDEPVLDVLGCAEVYDVCYVGVVEEQ
jgi:hypothetical protein